MNEVELTVDPSAGPFLVTSQAAAGATVAGGSSVPVTWAVNNTQGLAANVKISLSTDGGASFATVLAESTPNDGSETLTMPNVDAADVRIKIEAVGNYFFDVNDASFALTKTAPPAPGAPDTTITSGPADGSIVLERSQTIGYASTIPSSTFVCTVDEERVPCDASGLTDKFRAGTHVVEVAAVSPAGVADATPARISFTVPRNDSTFARKNKGELPKGGKAKVFLGKEKLGTVSFKGKTRFSKLRTFRLDEPQKGKLRIVLTKNKPVRIEGVAIVTDE